MDNKIKKPTDKWHYLEVNRGRYLCVRHGGFCDSSDGYTKECPLCNEAQKKSKNWQVNPIDRVLQVMKNLQSRSTRIISITSGATGLFGLVSIFKKDALSAYFLDLDPSSTNVLILFTIFFLSSFVFYFLSIAHMKTTRAKCCRIFGESKFPKKTIDGWEQHIVNRLSWFEDFHFTSNILLAFSGLCLIIFLLKQFL